MIIKNTLRLLYSILKALRSVGSADPIRKIISLFFLHFLLFSQAQSPIEENMQWKANWITANGQKSPTIGPHKQIL